MTDPLFISLDFETYGAVNLPKHGLMRYVRDDTFMPLLARASWFEGPRVAHAAYDFVGNPKRIAALLREQIGSGKIIAANAIFEQMVLSHLGLDYPSSRFIDAAVVARAAGAGPRLEAYGPQLLGIDKVAAGSNLMRLFSMPGEYQTGGFSSGHFNPKVIADHPQEYREYGDYCGTDSEIALKVVDQYVDWLTNKEFEFQTLTQDMNLKGWPVDIDAVVEMQRRYFENMEQAEQDFRSKHNAPDLNLNSLKQLKIWCGERGIKATSFAEKPLAKMLDRLEKKVETMSHSDPKHADYLDVCDLLRTKAIIGGSSLKKLQVIIDNTMADSEGVPRLYDQYLHYGAGQSGRTTGRTVQMQNLKRLSVVAEMDTLGDDYAEWDNEKLAENIRQVFRSSHEDGRLIVGDFKSVESRGLAHLAGETWKSDAYRQNKDLYVVLAAKIFGIAENAVTKIGRQAGKVGELSCGYGAGPEAVQSFAAGMGIELSLGEATKLVNDWRDACPATLEFWEWLNEALHDQVRGVRAASRLALPDDQTLVIQRCVTPQSLLDQHPGAQSIKMAVINRDGSVFLKRYFHGCYRRGGNIAYYKPSERKTGDLWKATFVDPKTKQLRYYELYGGKLAGILTQSFCREIFMRILKDVANFVAVTANLDLIGQFHDEIVLDWWPVPTSATSRTKDLNWSKKDFEILMSNARGVGLPSFPLAADIKDDYRYTK